jgi:hypothetical protein
MEKLYTLEELLLFFQRQYHDNWATIEAVVNLIEYKSENLKESEKEGIILKTLRTYGLFEIDYGGSREYLERITPIPEQVISSEDDIVWNQNTFEVKIEMYQIKLLNAEIQFLSFLN